MGTRSLEIGAGPHRELRPLGADGAEPTVSCWIFNLGTRDLKSEVQRCFNEGSPTYLQIFDLVRRLFAEIELR